MEEWVVAGLIGAVAGYGVRLWQEKVPNVVKRPAGAAVRTVGSALGAGASMGGRAAGATLTAAARRTGTRGGRKPVTRIPVSGEGQARPSGARSRRAGSTAAGSTRGATRRTGRQPRTRPS